MDRMDNALYDPEEVADAALWLDATYPGWADKVDPDTLNMQNTKLCVGGQIDVHWETLCDMWDKVSQETWGARRGKHVTQVFACMPEAWIEEINARKTLIHA